MPLVALIGASGAGKTTIARAVKERYAGAVEVFYFDQIGVPSVREMIEDYGSGERWQHATTRRWLKRLEPLIRADRRILFEGQTRLEFLADAIHQIGDPPYWPILVDCADALRTVRLVRDRQQPDLADSDMLDWATYLRGEAHAMGCEILDTGTHSLDQCVLKVARLLFPEGTSRR